MNKNILITALLIVFLLSFISAGVGLAWDRESSLVPESTKTCLTYKVYNPWTKDSYVQINLSQELQNIVTYIESETKYVPAETASKDAIPVEFCFKTPKIYKKDCLLFNRLICKQECTEPQKVYEGEVEVMEVPKEIAIGGTGGSSTTMSVSAPLRIKIQCVPHTRNYSLIYITVGLIASILLVINLLRKKKNKKK
ncbi:MAG: hypothetical protein ABH804_01850 [archaeon]